LPLDAELVYLVHARENADVVPEEHVLAYGDATPTGVEYRVVDNRRRVDGQPGGIAVHAVAVEGVNTFRLDALRNQSSHRRLEQSVQQSHRHPAPRV
jgi:hypothetical protein